MPAVDFGRTIEVAAAPAEAWKVITDVQRVASWVGVVGGVEEVEHLSRYRATLSDRLGPFQLTAQLDVDVTEATEGSLIRFVADGEDDQVASRILVEAELRLAGSGPGTEMQVEGRYEVTGRVATLGASMIKNKGDKILDEFFNAATEELS